MMAPQMPPNQGNAGNSNEQPPPNSPFFPDISAVPPLHGQRRVALRTGRAGDNTLHILIRHHNSHILSRLIDILADHVRREHNNRLSPSPDHARLHVIHHPHPHHDSSGNQYPQQQQQQNVGGLSGGVLAAAGVIATLIVVLMLAACCCVVFRKRRRRSPSAPAIMQPMIKTPGPTPLARAHVRNPEPAAAASLTSPSTTSTPSTNARHVLLTTTMDQSYYTGIDTSDAISLAERQPQPATAMSDEPPPPYRPRSVPPVSRGHSLRVTDGLAGYQPGQNMRSPFDDPVDEDDGLSDLGNDCGGRDVDRLSAVSDLSYQEEPTAVRSGL